MIYQKGQIVFLNWNNKFMNLIRYYNELKYGIPGFSHVGIITRVEKNRVQIHEAISKGFVKSWYDKDFLNKKIDGLSSEILGIGEKLENIEKVADNYLGRPYGFLDIFGIALSFLFKFKFLKLTGANSLICSEAVSRILYECSDGKINLEEFFDKPFDLITPMDIYIYIKEKGVK